jgi:hypothetical protein
MWIPFVGPIIDKVLGVIDKIVPDSDLATKLKAEAALEAMKLDYSEVNTLVEAWAKVIASEYENGNSLSRSWRPITILTFTYIIAHNYIFVTMFSLPHLVVFFRSQIAFFQT